MAICYYEKMGKMTIKQNQGGEIKKFKIDIWRGNCLAVFNHEYEKDGEQWIQLYSFFADEKHCKNIAKSENGKLFWDEVQGIELNTFYPSAIKLANILIKYKYKVTCYYKEPKAKKGKNNESK